MVQFHRARGLINLDLVRKSTLVLIGCGSLGSQSIMHLAFPWARLVLIDPDKLSVENVERHLLGYPDVGKYKVTSIKRWLVYQRKLDRHKIITHRLTADKVLGRYPRASMIIETTGIPTVRQLANAWAVSNGIPAIYAGIHLRGTGGEIVAINNPAHSCLACYDSFDGGEDPITNYGLPEASVDPETGDVSEAPYLSGPVAATAADVQDYALDMLAGVDTPNQRLVHAHKPKPVYRLSQTAADRLQAHIDYQTSLGFIPTQSIQADQGDRLTLQVARAKIARNIQPSSGCPFHFAAAKG